MKNPHLTSTSAAQLISFAPPPQWARMDCKRKLTVTGLHGGLNLAVDQSPSKKPVERRGTQKKQAREEKSRMKVEKCEGLEGRTRRSE